MTPAVPSATRGRFLGFASAMSLDLTTLRRRLQKALGKKFTVGNVLGEGGFAAVFRVRDQDLGQDVAVRSEEHTSELQSRGQLVCRLLLEKKNLRLQSPRFV